MDYNVGDTITYVTTMGELRTGVVMLKEADINKGRPGFDMKMADGLAVWGYDDQIVRVGS